jgi:RNA polymerase sigma factor (sigma-70 family)
MSEGLNGNTAAKEGGGKRTAFEDSRRRLLSIAYRMLGSRAEAEDIVQETYLRWHAAEVSELRTPVAWLTTVATRLAIDRLRRLQLERESQAGVFVPQPWVEEFVPSAEAVVARESELSYGLLLLLERLSPEERAALVLHEAFDCGYSEIGLVLAKTAPACRQIVHRAKVRLRGFDAPRQPRPGRSPVPSHLLERLRDAIESQDKEAFIGLMAEDAQMVVTVPDARAAVPQLDARATTTVLDARSLDADPPMANTGDAGLSVTGLSTSGMASRQANALAKMGLGGAIHVSLEMLAEHIAGVRPVSVRAETLAFSGHTGVALIQDDEVVGVLYVEARGTWIARCYLTTAASHLSAANRVLGLNANSLETMC